MDRVHSVYSIILIRHICILSEPARMTYRLQYSAAEHHSLLTAAIDRSIFLLAGSFLAGASSSLSSLVWLLSNN